MTRSLLTGGLLILAVGAHAQFSPESSLDETMSAAVDVAPPGAGGDLVPKQRSPGEIYNTAVGLYRDGDYVGAADGFAMVAKHDDRTLAAKARFNLGNCYYAQALQQLETGDEPAAAANQLQTAIMLYRSVLRLQPHDDDARANLELAMRILDQLKPPDKPEDPEDPEDPDEPGQSSQPDESQPDESQPDESAENQPSPPSDSSQEQEQPSPTNEDSSEDAADQTPPSDDENTDGTESSRNEQAESEESQSGGDSSDQSAPEDIAKNEPHDSSTEGDSDASDTDQANAAGERTGEDPSQSASTEPEPPSPTERPPDGKLEAAGNQAEDVGDQSAVDVTAAGQMMTQQEAMKMLQSIRDRDMIRRYRREAAKRSRYLPVERDW